jgi:hypothetical protein
MCLVIMCHFAKDKLHIFVKVVFNCRGTKVSVDWSQCHACKMENAARRSVYSSAFSDPIVTAVCLGFCNVTGLYQLCIACLSNS